MRAREALPVAVRGQHVGEARQRVEPVLLAEVHRRLVAEPPVHLGRVVEVVVRERIELDRGRGHGVSSIVVVGAPCRTGRPRAPAPRPRD